MHVHDNARRGIGWGPFWGLLFGMLFAVPVVGAAAGAAGGAFARIGTGSASPTRLKRIRAEVTRGTSALFLVTEEADRDRLGDRMRGLFTKLVDTNLTDAERSVLQETFGAS